MLRKYTPDPSHVVDWGGIIVYIDGTFEEGPIHIMDSRDHAASESIVATLRSRGGNMGTKDTICATYPFLFQDEGVLSNIWN